MKLLEGSEVETLDREPERTVVRRALLSDPEAVEHIFYFFLP